MGSWILTNLSTIIICVLLIGIVTFLILKMRSDKKKGKSSCSCNCAHCAMAGKCHGSK